MARKIIPRSLVSHLEWKPGLAPVPPQPPLPPEGNGQLIDIEAIVNGRTFYDNTQVGGEFVGLPIALGHALAHAGADGFVPNLIEFLAAKVLAPKTHSFWTRWYSVHSEENIGIDKDGKIYPRNTPVYVIVNGGGILTPARIKQAYADGLVDHSAKYTDPEFDGLLGGNLPDGTKLELFKFEDIKTGMTNRPHRFGIVVPYSTVQGTKSGFHKINEFLANPLVIARGAGDLETLRKYFDLAKDGDGDVGNYHSFSGREATQPQGRLLFVDYD